MKTRVKLQLRLILKKIFDFSSLLLIILPVSINAQEKSIEYKKELGKVLQLAVSTREANLVLPFFDKGHISGAADAEMYNFNFFLMLNKLGCFAAVEGLESEGIKIDPEVCLLFKYKDIKIFHQEFYYDGRLDTIKAGNKLNNPSVAQLILGAFDSGYMVGQRENEPTQSQTNLEIFRGCALTVASYVTESEGLRICSPIADKIFDVLKRKGAFDNFQFP